MGKPDVKPRELKILSSGLQGAVECFSTRFTVRNRAVTSEDYADERLSRTQ